MFRVSSEVEGFGLGFGVVLMYTLILHQSSIPNVQIEKPLQWQHANLDAVLCFLREEANAGRFHPLMDL